MFAALCCITYYCNGQSLDESIWKDNNNCFGNNKIFGSNKEAMTYIYTMNDKSGNYSTIREYWLVKNQTCEFIVDSNSMVDWYVTDITAEY